VLDAKGEKIRPKQEMDQLSLENFEKVELEFFLSRYSFLFLIVKSTLVCFLLSKVGLLWGEWLIMGKGGVF
jgi:hypothetical protein